MIPMPCALDDAQLLALLAEDVPFGDLTSESLPLSTVTSGLTFAARQPMTACGLEEAARLFQLAGASASVLLPSGTSVAAGSLLLRARGTPLQLLRVWKAAQILVEWSSGLASATAAIVAAAKGVPVACTRKNAPGTKALSVKSVRAGGGIIHRLGLSESLLLFAEHRQFLELSAEAVLEQLRRHHPEQRRSVEVHDLADALHWAAAGAEILQLDKFTPTQVAECKLGCERLGRVPLIAAAGGINATNAGDYATAGADLLVTSAPYWAPPKDVQVRFQPGEGTA